MKLGTESKLKFKCLQRRLGLSLHATVGLLETLWLVTYSNAPAGDIGRLSNEEIAAAIEWDRDADELVQALVEYCWLDLDDESRLIVHDWSEHCAQFLKGAFAKHGKTFADISAKHRAKERAKQDAEQPANSTLPGNMPPIQSNSIQSNSSQAKSILPPPTVAETLPKYPKDFERFWEAYPKHKGKAPALKAWKKVIKTRTASSIIEAAVIFATSDDGQAGKFCPHASTWLNEGRFDDDPKDWNHTNGKSKPSAGKSYDENAVGNI